MNLIEPKYDINSYFCTWTSQADLCRILPCKAENPSVRDTLCDETVFGDGGLVHQFPEVRDKLIFLFDDGWDVPYGLLDNGNGDFGSLIVNEERFPFCDGEPKERLKKLVDRVKSHGWKDVGIWVCASGRGERDGAIFSYEKREEYWRERLEWSKYAQIVYWKVDWGVFCCDTNFRHQLNMWKEEIYPELIIEHAAICDPLSGIEKKICSNEQSGRFADWGEKPQEILKLEKFSDVIRSYDVSPVLSVPTTIDRVQYLLRTGTALESESHVNAEDEAYICAALSFEIGIMCNQLKDLDGTYIHKKATEAIRAVNWLTSFAPSYPIGVGNVRFSSDILVDKFNFYETKSWMGDYGDRLIPQGAPSLIARNSNLPEVEYITDEKPFIVTSRHPNGTLALAVLQRFAVEKGFYVPPVKIKVEQDLESPIGVFG
ncbi:MAG: hypothetical protein J6D52_12050, partial [Clostridia bacterium]|nr:hypothetical protein [Clostridia bacterium]